MSNDYFSHSNLPRRGIARSTDVNAQFQLVEAGFGKLPGLNELPIMHPAVGGTANAITVTTGYGLTALQPGWHGTFVATASNTGAVTISVDSVGAKAALTIGSRAALPANFIRSGHVVPFTYDGTNFIIDREPDVIANANGRADRYADGTQTCHHTVSLTYASASQLSGVWTYPAAFAATGSLPSVVFNSIEDGFPGATPPKTDLGYQEANGSRTQATLLIFRITGGTDFTALDGTAVTAVAQGRWY